MRHLFTGPGIRLMSGIAGSGKTTTMLTCAESAAKAGREVLGCALAGKAATKLQKETGIESGTLASLLWRLENGRHFASRPKTVVLDEAGMVGTKDMAKLIQHVEKEKDARLMLLGDAKQLQPIDAGGPFKFLSDILGEKRLTIIRRQSLPWQRDAVAAIERGDAQEALKAFIENKCFHLADNREQAKAQLVEQWKKDGGIQKPESVSLRLDQRRGDRHKPQAQAARIQAGVVSAEKKVFANGVFLHEGDPSCS